MADGFPVFYDKSGKRLRRFVIVTIAMLCVPFGAGIYLAPAVLAPTRVERSDDHFARSFLATGDPSRIPVVGDARDGVMTRMVTVVQEHGGPGAPPRAPASVDAGNWGWWEDGVAAPPMPPLKLLDAATGEYLRDARGIRARQHRRPTVRHRALRPAARQDAHADVRRRPRPHLDAADSGCPGARARRGHVLRDRIQCGALPGHLPADDPRGSHGREPHDRHIWTSTSRATSAISRSWLATDRIMRAEDTIPRRCSGYRKATRTTTA